MITTDRIKSLHNIEVNKSIQEIIKSLVIFRINPNTGIEQRIEAAKYFDQNYFETLEGESISLVLTAINQDTSNNPKLNNETRRRFLSNILEARFKDKRAVDRAKSDGNDLLNKNCSLNRTLKTYTTKYKNLTLLFLQMFEPLEC